MSGTRKDLIAKCFSQVENLLQKVLMNMMVMVMIMNIVMIENMVILRCQNVKRKKKNEHSDIVQSSQATYTFKTF
jgi:hypothetical protein